ncbi:MAG: DinB family protein [Chitinophagaceae bacterium]
MKETKRIANLLDDIYQGSPWIDVNLTGTLSNISPEQAAKKVAPQWNTIWEIVNHLINWRLSVLQRIQDKVIASPADNYFSPVKDLSAEAWQNTLKKLEDSQKQWMLVLKKFKKKDLEKNYPANGMTYYDHIQGIIQHDAYHLGQIVLLAKLV